MTADKEFIQERGMRKRKKAKNMLEGFGQGAVSLFTGVTDGVIGVVTQPLKGAKEDGVGGLFKGIAKGLTGLVTKPVSGVLDTISKAAEVRMTDGRASKTPQEEATWGTSRAFGLREPSTAPTGQSEPTPATMRSSTSR